MGGIFGGLFGGGGHHNAPQPPPQVEPADPETYATFTRAANFANPLGAIIFAVPTVLVPELGGVGGVAAGLGGVTETAADVETATVSASQLGREGEDAVRSVYDVGEKQAINGGTRIPDGLNEAALSEVKNVQNLSFTRQIRDYSQYAQQNNLRFDSYVRLLRDFRVLCKERLTTVLLIC